MTTTNTATQTKTTRRTAKITSKQTKTTRRTAKITSKPYAPATLTRVYDKKTGVCLGYLAPSRDGREYYQVTCDENAIWHCTCKATIENCCHVKAAKELCEIRVKQGRPACRAAVVIVEGTPEISNEEMAVIAAAAHLAAEEAEPAKREMRVVETRAYMRRPEYRDGDGNWQSFKDEAGEVVRFGDAYEDLAHKFIAEDSDEHRAAVLAEYKQSIAEYAAAEEAREVAESAQRKAESDRRLSAPINGSRGIGFAPIVAPMLAAGRAVPMR